MTCQEAAPFVSVLYDGEAVEQPVAEHIAQCVACRQKLRSYAQIGAELRLHAGAHSTREAMPASLASRLSSTRRRWFVFNPRFAVAMLAGAALALSATLPLVHAQDKPLWFQFELTPGSTDGRTRQAAQAGFDGSEIWMYPPESPLISGKAVPLKQVAAHMAVTEVSNGQVKLSIHAREYPAEENVSRRLKSDLPLEGHSLVYAPGQTLMVPVDGGGVLTLRGEVKDHQPKFSNGLPVDPETDQLVLNSPVLIANGTVLADLQGAGSLAQDKVPASDAIVLAAPGAGRFVLALHSFPGAMNANANWGQLRFQSHGTDYTLLSGSPLTGGAQPRAVWIRQDSEWKPDNMSLGVGPLESLSK